MARTNRPTSRAGTDLPPNTFVLDNGAYTIKAGFASDEDIPDKEKLKRCETIPNCLVRSRERKTHIASQTDEITQWSEAVYRRPVENGQLVSWETQKEIWDYSLFDEKTASSKSFVRDPEHTTLLYAETPNTMPALQKNTDEIIMEEWGFGGYMRVVGPSLNAYNDLHPVFERVGASKAHSDLKHLPMECLLVIDSGYSYTTITPCFRGLPIQRAIRRFDFGGKHLTNLLKETISLRYFDLHQDTKIVNDIKEDVCFVSSNLKVDLENAWKGNKQNSSGTLNPIGEDEGMEIDDWRNEVRIDYVLPDGVTLPRGFVRAHDPSVAAARKRKMGSANPDNNEVVMTLGNERFSTPEIMFTPSDVGSQQPGIVDCILQSLEKLPRLVQATMLANTLVIGGNANIPGLVERLQDDLRARVQTEWQVNVRKMDDPVTSTWLGGARMACNHYDVIQQKAVTKAEYLEHGSNSLLRKFASTG